MTNLPTSLSEAAVSGDPSAVLAAALVHFGCQAGTVHLLQDGALKLVAHSGIPPAVVQIVSSVPIGKGIAGLAAERREPITICNLQTDTSGQARPAARNTGMEGSIAVPMLVRGELRGVLGVAKSTAHDWTPQETAVLSALAERLGERVPVNTAL